MGEKNSLSYMAHVTDTKLVVLYSEASAFPVISEFQSLIHVLFLDKQYAR